MSKIMSAVLYGVSSSGAPWQPRGWDWVGGDREVQEGGDICIPVADSCCCMAEISTILKSNYPLVKHK